MVHFASEEARIKEVYAKRDSSGKPSLYAWHREEVLFTQYRFRAVAASLLKRSGLTDLSHIEVLDVGCGAGRWLHTLLEWGTRPEHLHGIDLLEDRIEKARALGMGIDFQVASGYEIPFPENSMDLVSAHTVFSSILAPSARKTLAGEIARILKNTGKILIYDYRISDPRNPDTVGIRKREIQRLFSDFTIQLRSLTLAPPILRRVAPVSPLLAHVLEYWFPFLRTHAFYLISSRKGTKTLR